MPETLEFARLRAEFHRLLDLEAGMRADAIAAMAKAEPELAAELGAMFAAEPSPEHAIAPGTVIGGWTLEEEIGRGGMGVVWRASRQQHGASLQAALKLMHPGLLSASSQRRFRREWAALARLDHPAIARLVDAGIDGGRPWLAMAFVDGQTLDAAASGASLRQRVAWLTSIAKAVAHAHARLVLHRDLKPSNVRVDREGRAHLLDFGIAGLLDDSAPGLTLTGLRPCTPRYAAPEVLRGEPLGAAADVYSLGVMLRELCADAGGRIGDGLLRAVIERAVAPDPAARYPSADALAADLADWLAGRTLRSGVGATGPRLRRWLHAWRWPLGSAVAVLLTLGLGALATWQQAERASNEAERSAAHLAAVLDVIGAASPEIYAGSDPSASDVLIEAARRIEAMPAADAELRWQSLVRIGAGLVNLGRYPEAADVLDAALAAAEDAGGPEQATRRLEALGLRLWTLQSDSPDGQLEALSGLIEMAAADVSAQPGPALSALANAAAIWSQRGGYERGRRMLAQAEAFLADPRTLPTQRENYWRQRGWLELRAGDLAAARSALEQALAEIEAHPGAFSTMRRAEAHWLLAECALRARDAAVASHWLALARPTYLSEYPEGHPERAVFEEMERRLVALEAIP
jgi:eukaryotic-like serine/threonine-protein kinase